MGKAWDMEFNPSKCQVLHISRSRKPIKHSYTMHGQILDSIDHARYLGVDISSDLNFNHHINRVTSNASKSLGFLKRNIKYIYIREAAYKTTVRPQVEYASSVWSPYTKKDIHKVEMVQRRATRWILNYSPYQSVTELQQQLNLRTLEQRRVDAKVIMMFKIIHGLVAIPVPPYFEQPMRSTRHSHPLHYVRFIQQQIITNLPFSLNCCLLESAPSPDRTSAHSGPDQCGSTGA